MGKVCVIGAGSSGIAACQVLHARGMDFDCFEKGSGVGGNWRYDNDNGMSSAYRSLFINTSRRMMEYATYPMPEDYPDYPHHTQIAAYFDDYVDHFRFRERIRFRTEVTSVEPAPGGSYRVTLDDGQTHHYEAVLVANGHHWDPRLPEPPFPGQDTFAGDQLHAHWYREPDERFIEKRVLVLGIGNSATDISVETSRHSAITYLAMRRGAYVIPKYIGGKPTDELAPAWMSRLPFAVTRRLFMQQLRQVTGKMESYGLPKPDHKLGEAHPTISSDLLPRIGHGRVKVKPNLARIDGKTVHFVDDTSTEIDTIVVHRLQDHLPVPVLGGDRDRGQPGVALPPGGASAAAGPVLHRARAAARRDHADRRAAVGVDRRPARGQVGATGPGHHAPRDRRRAGGHAAPLRRLAPPHDPGGLPALHEAASH